MKTEKEIKKLSDSELDDLIEHGVNQQETVPRHSEIYQQHLNTVAAAKEEKAGREHAKTKGSGKDVTEITAQGVGADEQTVQDMNHGQTSRVESEKGKETDGKAKKPKPTVPGPADEIPADRINTGLPGVTPAAAEETPENSSKAAHPGKDIKA